MSGPVPSRTRARIFVGAAGIACAVAAGVLLYGRLPGSTKTDAQACPRSIALSRAATPLETGEVAAMNAPPAIAPMPALAFNGPDGKAKTLADFRGKTVLLNLWATWCVPCREEMPALDKLQSQARSETFEIVAVNIDTTRLQRPKAFLEEIGVKNLTFYSDSRADIFYALKKAGKVVGLPTTFLIGPDGCEIGALAGGANWGSADALALVKSASGG